MIEKGNPKPQAYTNKTRTYKQPTEKRKFACERPRKERDMGENAGKFVLFYAFQIMQIAFSKLDGPL